MWFHEQLNYDHQQYKHYAPLKPSTNLITTLGCQRQQPNPTWQLWLELHRQTVILDHGLGVKHEGHVHEDSVVLSDCKVMEHAGEGYVDGE